MTTYDRSDLRVINDPLEVFRNNPAMYAGEEPRGPRFAARLLRDLILLDAVPARVDHEGAWWLIASEKDWLRSTSGQVSKEPFQKIVNFPLGGHATFRTELLLTAFAEAVVTAGSDGSEWVVPNDTYQDLPTHWQSEIEQLKHGRLVAFRISDHR